MRDDLTPEVLALLGEFVGNFLVPAAVLDAEARLVAVNQGFVAAAQVEGRSCCGKPASDVFCRSSGRRATARDFDPGIRRCYRLLGLADAQSRIEVSIRPLDLSTSFPGFPAVYRLMQIHDAAVPIETRSGALEVSELGYTLAMRGGADGMWEWNPLTKDLYLSPRLLAIFGYPEGFEVRSTDEWIELVHPDDRSFYNAENRRHLRQETPYFQCEYRIRRADGEWAWGYSRGVAWFDEHGTARRMGGSITDISARKKAEVALDHARQELEALNASLEQRVDDRTRELAVALDALQRTHSSLHTARQQLAQAEMQASLGRMVAVIAHELNTPIGNSRIAASTLHHEAQVFMEGVEGGLRRSELNEFLRTLESGTQLLDHSLQRAAGLIASFKQVAVDQTSAQRRRFELDVLVNEIRTTLSPGLKLSGCSHDWQVVAGLSMDSFPGPLGQVLMNLVDNAAVHAFDGRQPGNVAVRISAHGPDEICLEVRDDGIGVPEELQQRIFEPFFTTRMGRGGTGLGLSIVYSIVSGVLGGTISLQSRPQCGSTFRVLIPKLAPVRPDSSPPLLDHSRKMAT